MAFIGPWPVGRWGALVTDCVPALSPLCIRGHSDAAAAATEAHGQKERRRRDREPEFSSRRESPRSADVKELRECPEPKVKKRKSGLRKRRPTLPCVIWSKPTCVRSAQNATNAKADRVVLLFAFSFKSATVPRWPPATTGHVHLIPSPLICIQASGGMWRMLTSNKDSGFGARVSRRRRERHA
jgi:hypothetical protein